MAANFIFFSLEEAQSSPSLRDILVAALYTKVKCNATDVDWTKNIIFLQTNPEKNSKKKGGSRTKTNCYIIDFIKVFSFLIKLEMASADLFIFLVSTFFVRF